METATWIGALAGVVLAVLALIAFITNPIKKIRDNFENLRNDVGSRIDDVAKEGRDAHAEIGKNIENLRNDVGSRIDDVAKEGRDAHAEIGKNIENATERLSRELGAQINGLQGHINGLQTTMGDVRQDIGRLQGTVEQIDTK